MQTQSSMQTDMSPRIRELTDALVKHGLLDRGAPLRTIVRGEYLLTPFEDVPQGRVTLALIHAAWPAPGFAFIVSPCEGWFVKANWPLNSHFRIRAEDSPLMTAWSGIRFRDRALGLLTRDNALAAIDHVVATFAAIPAA